jgi:UDP-glucose 4-epimerase
VGLFDGRRILITGGTGSLGQVLTWRILSGVLGDPAKVILFSRDEAKQHNMRVAYHQRTASTDEIIYENFRRRLEFRIGDVRDFHSVASVLREVDIVFNSAALKQVPTCEYFPFEAVRTNIMGPENIVRAIETLDLPVDTVVGISTDKACKPINTMGMTKAIQERIFVQANMRCRGTRFICARYGNVLASRGSVIPLFHEQIRAGGPVTITAPEMTRFLLSLEDAVDTVLAAVEYGRPGETFVPRVPSALVMNVARVLIGDRPVEMRITGIRPGEKIHEILVSDEEAQRTSLRDRWYVVAPMLPELAAAPPPEPALRGEYSSRDNVLDRADTARLLRDEGLLVEDAQPELELLR